MIHTSPTVQTPTVGTVPHAVISSDWRSSLPVLNGNGVTLRELRLSDAPSLLTLLSTEEVSRFISPPPTSVDGFERFISWSHRERSAGKYVCFGLVPTGQVQAVGIIQVRQLSASFKLAEWGFAIGAEFWGTGLFPKAAREVVRFSFETLGTERLEARSSVENGRGNGALQKIGATREGVLSKSFLLNGEYHDQVLWSIDASDWRTCVNSVAVTRH